MKRGDNIVVCGVVGRYVGTSKAGVKWICYEGQDYAEMCKAFDRI